MELISKEKIVELSNPGVVSRQLLNPENSSSERVTIAEVFYLVMILSDKMFLIDLLKKPDL